MRRWLADGARTGSPLSYTPPPGYTASVMPARPPARDATLPLRGPAKPRFRTRRSVYFVNFRGPKGATRPHQAAIPHP